MAKPQKKDTGTPTAVGERRRGWKGDKIRELKDQFPHHTQAALAEEFKKATGEEVSIATVVQALKEGREGKGGGNETLNDVVRVHKWCTENDVKLEDLSQQIEMLNQLADRVGGVASLNRILTVMKTMRG